MKQNSIKPLVTVLIPTCNQDSYIKKAVQSVLDQTYENIEIIVSDDSDNDITQKIIEKQFKPQVKYTHNKPAKGRVENYHYLLYELASGEWVINLDGDDYFQDNDFIKKAVNLTQKHPDVAFVFTKQVVMDLKSGETVAVENKNLKKLLLNNQQETMLLAPNSMPQALCPILHAPCSLLLSGNWLLLNSIFKNIEIPHLGTMYNRVKSIEVGFYQSDISSTDRESLLKLAINNKVAFLNTFSGVWVQHGDNATAKMSPDEIVDNLKMYDSLYNYAKKHSGISMSMLTFWRIWAKYKSSYAHLLIIMKSGDKQKLKEYRKAVCKNEPLIFLLQVFDFRIYKEKIQRYFTKRKQS